MTKYQSTIENYINRITELQGTLFHIWSILRKDYQKVFERYMKSEIDDQPSLISNILVISDITGPTDNGWEYNYPAGNSRNIPYSKYEAEIANLVARESAFMCAQSHEAFETYFNRGVNRYHPSAKTATTFYFDCN